MYNYRNEPLDTRKVLVMNQITWDAMQKEMVEQASYEADPLASLGRFSGIDVIIDNDLPLLHVEVYERWMYEAVKKYGRMSDNG
jgi:hypothetical protein